MQFNPDPNTQANEVFFFYRKTNNSSHPPVAFNDNDIKKYPNHKHLGIVVDSKLDFKFHDDQKIKKCQCQCHCKCQCPKESLSHYIQIVY